MASKPKKKVQPPTPVRLSIDRRAHMVIAELRDLPGDMILSTKEASTIDGMSVVWHETARAGGYGPPWVKRGLRGIGYRVDDLRRWLMSRTSNQGDEPMPSVKKPEYLETERGDLIRHDAVKMFQRDGKQVIAILDDAGKNRHALKARDMSEVLHPELIAQRERAA